MKIKDKLFFINFHRKRFVSQFKDTLLDIETGCHELYGSTGYTPRFVSGFYGNTHKKVGFNIPLHVLSFVLKNSMYPGKKHIIHHNCLNKCCVNPDHLELMTSKKHKKLHLNLADNSS